MVEIKCLACDKTLELPRFIDTDNYDGQVVCQECKSLLHVRLVHGKVQKYKIVENKSEGFNFTKLALDMKRKRDKQEKEK